jgi:hypothetical protein
MQDREGVVSEQIDRDERKESTTVNKTLYDVVALESYLESNPEAVEIVSMSLQDQRLLDAVAEGQHYWNTEDGEHIGPHDIISRWQKYQAEHQDAMIDEFLEQLTKDKPTWGNHIKSLQYARSQLSKPIWLISGADQQYPFNGMHRLTIAYMENLNIIPAALWTKLPESAIQK